MNKRVFSLYGPRLDNRRRTIRAILRNPRYTGRQVWNHQRREEVLLDVDDVASGHQTKMRWNDPDEWVWSEEPAHERIISVELFEAAQQGFARTKPRRRSGRSARPYLFADMPTDSQPKTTGSLDDAAGLVFGRALPWTLVFDDGTEGVKVLDLNDGVPVVRAIQGSHGGDQPYRLTIHDNRLVVGWDLIYAHDITTGTSSLLGSATIHVPAAEPARVWMVDYPGAISSGPPEVWQVFVSGGQTSNRQILDVDGFPAHGIPGGLALETDDGILLWNAATGTATGRVGAGVSFVSDVTADGRLAWCQNACEEMRVTFLEEDNEITVRHPDEAAFFDARYARFSDDGRYLAAPAGDDVVVVDVASGTSRVAFTVPNRGTVPLFVAWAPGGHHLFSATYSYGSAETTLAHHAVATETTEISTLPHGGTLSFVVVPTNEAAALLGTQPAEVPETGQEEGLSCPVTIPDSLFTPPDPYPADPVHSGMVWYGTDELWTVLDANGTTGPRMSVWWSINFPGGATESEPEIGVTWEHLDDPDAPRHIHEPPGTNAYTPEDGDFMIAGIDPDTPGCWKVTATYKGATLSYIYENP